MFASGDAGSPAQIGLEFLIILALHPCPEMARCHAWDLLLTAAKSLHSDRLPLLFLPILWHRLLLRLLIIRLLAVALNEARLLRLLLAKTATIGLLLKSALLLRLAVGTTVERLRLILRLTLLLIGCVLLPLIWVVRSDPCIIEAIS